MVTPYLSSYLYLFLCLIKRIIRRDLSKDKNSEKPNSDDSPPRSSLYGLSSRERGRLPFLYLWTASKYPKYWRLALWHRQDIGRNIQCPHLLLAWSATFVFYMYSFFYVETLRLTLNTPVQESTCAVWNMMTSWRSKDWIAWRLAISFSF